MARWSLTIAGERLHLGRVTLRPGWRGALPVLLLTAVTCIFFPGLASGRQVPWGADLSKLMYPLFTVLGTALRHLDFARLIWNPDIYAGFPLLAEGQAGALYPVSWLTLTWLSPLAALSADLIISHWLAAVATHWYARLVGLRPDAAFSAALVFAFGGFSMGQIGHVNILRSIAWLPIILALLELAAQRANWRYTLLAGLAWGVQWLAGQPQIAFMTLLFVAFYIAFRPVGTGKGLPGRSGRLIRPALTGGLFVAAGLALAAVYLLPLSELSALSVRPGGRLTYAEATSLSLPLRSLLTAVLPFFYGAPGTFWGLGDFTEMAFYAGLPVLALGITALVKSGQRRLAMLFTAAAGFALLLALGGNTPLYRWLYALPGFGSFRVPARWVFLMDFCLALLAGLGLQALPRHRRWARRLAIACAGLGALLLASPRLLHGWLANPEGGADLQRVLSAWLARAGDLDPVGQGQRMYAGLLRGTDLRDMYVVLPSVLLCLCAGWLWLLDRGVSRRLWSWLGVGLVAVDLWFFAAHTQQLFLLDTATHTVPPTRPALGQVAGQPLSRAYVLLSARPWDAASDSALTYGASDLGGYSSLELGRHDRYLRSFFTNDAFDRALDLASVDTIVDPAQKLPAMVWQYEDVAFTLHHAMLKLAPGGQTATGRFVLPDAPVLHLGLVTCLEDAAGIADGVPVVRLTLTGADGQQYAYLLRAGADTADRLHDVAAQAASMQHRSAPVAYSWGWPDGRSSGHFYYSQVALPSPMTVARLELEYLAPEGQFWLLGLSLAGGPGTVTRLSPYMREGYDGVYRDPSDAVYENENALPRAYAVHAVKKVAGEDAALAALQAPGFVPGAGVVLEDPEAPQPTGHGPSSVTIERYAPMQVDLRARMAGDGYVVLNDTYYPGWQASVDGRPARVYQANYLFRAVYVPGGEHRISFSYRPRLLWLGAGISLATLLVSLLLLVWVRRGRATA